MSSSASTPTARARGPVVLKRLNEMDRLGDLGRFPVSVWSGALINVLLTIGLVWHFEPQTEQYFFALPIILGGVLALNLVPVLLLRIFTLGPETEYPPIEEMDFFRDQHKFSNWVYLAASANMALWISATWLTSYAEHHHAEIVTLMAAATVITLSPAWLRIFQK